MKDTPNKPRLLTGDTPTGRLHLGHWVGSLENRILMQNEYDCYFLIANVHAFTTRMDKPDEVHQSVIDVTMDYLAAGIDPKKSTIFLQSEIPAIAELTFFFSMLIPYPRLMRNPTIKDEIRDKGLGDNYPVGFLLYPVGQVADILAFRPIVVPVGEDQVPHLEMAREVARRFNQLYCHVNSHTEDVDYPKKGGLFPIFEVKLGRSRRLVGIGPPGPDGKLYKMSKSLNNAILLSDPPDTVKQKVMAMYTDPKRLKSTDKGSIENNPLWIFHEMFNPDQAWVREVEDQYRNGQIGDVACKKRLVDVLVAIIEPIRQRRLQYEQDISYVQAVLKEGTARANEVADHTLILAKDAMKQRYY
ncbi:MAG TPA: tryptophan--tRNA ligase [Gammaproteobacteria bacterium]|nr:tryptophan--tRNA ligase [Gammaproteobacteria bacterium]